MKTHDSKRRPLFENLLASKPEKDQGFRDAVIVSVVVHAAVVILILTLQKGAAKEKNESEEEFFQIFIEEEKPPPDIVLPVPPIAKTPNLEKVVKDLQKEPQKGYQVIAAPEIILPEIPPPPSISLIQEHDFTGEGARGSSGGDSSRTVTAEDIDVTPVFTPRTVEPELKNRKEVSRKLKRLYPVNLQNAGIEGTVMLWILVSEDGKLLKVLVQESSGHSALDEIALEVTKIMKFSPALNWDRTVRVWVSLPVIFKIDSKRR